MLTNKEFAPIKNKDGDNDTPETAIKLLNEYNKRRILKFCSVNQALKIKGLESIMLNSKFFYNDEGLKKTLEIHIDADNPNYLI